MALMTLKKFKTIFLIRSLYNSVFEPKAIKYLNTEILITYCLSTKILSKLCLVLHKNVQKSLHEIFITIAIIGWFKPIKYLHGHSSLFVDAQAPQIKKLSRTKVRSI
jgi:hypothetical protein